MLRVNTHLSITGWLFSVVLLLLSSSIYAVSLDLKLEGLDGRKHALSEYVGHGQWVVLNIWGTRCPPCQEEMPELVLFHESHKDHDAIVVGIAIDFPSFDYADKEEVAEFVEQHLVDYPILLSDGNVTHRLGLGPLRGVPMTYIFKPDGELIGQQLGTVDREALERFIRAHSEKTMKNNKKGKIPVE